MSFLKNISKAIASIGNNKTKNNLDNKATDEISSEELEGDKIGASKEAIILFIDGIILNVAATNTPNTVIKLNVSSP